MSRYFVIEKLTQIKADNTLDGKVLSDLWHGFCFRKGNCSFTEGEAGKIAIGNASFIPLSEDDEYTLSIKEDGIGIVGKDKNCLLRGFMMLMMCIEQASSEKNQVVCGDIHGKFNVSRRMIHICVFPETTFDYFKRLVRLCGVLQYTHLIVEFWGMLKYDCMKELSWECGFEKDKVKDVLTEAREMGMELIPMFNHLGHASQCRVMNGKHTVLDQNLSLSYLFTPDGWAWNIRLEETKALLKKIREELYELFGEGDYFHLGCDEAYIFSNGYISNEELRNYLGEITSVIASEGRKPIVWADMLIGHNEADLTGARYYCAKVENSEAELIRSMLHKETIIADWQYNVKEGKINSSIMLHDKGFKTVVCPWYDPNNIRSCADTVIEKNMYGFMETTWNTLTNEMQSILIAARKCGLPHTAWSQYAKAKTEIAALIRKIADEGRIYEECGFTAHQMGERNLN